jgi:acyl homoserine lactone synthase
MHLINAGNRHLYERELQDMYRARKQIFVDGFGWDLKLTDGMDIDQFDDDRAEYVVGYDSAQNSVMSLRLRPTDDISLLGDLFGHVLPPETRPLDDGRTWEATRGFCLEYGRKPWNMQRKGACMTAPFEIMHSRGMDRLVAFTDTRMFTFVVNMGWQFRILGDAVQYGQGAGFALEVDVTDELIGSMRDMWGLPGPGYVYVDHLEPGETVHIAAMRLARAQGIDFLAARDDLSRLRRDRSKPAVATAAAA